MARKLALVLFAAACSAHPNTVADPAEVMPVPLTAATSSIALQQVSHQDLVPPWTLTSSEGEGLMLTRVDAKAVVEGPLAYTELHLYFHNPENRRREGTYADPHGHGAVVPVADHAHAYIAWQLRLPAPYPVAGDEPWLDAIQRVRRW